MSTHTHTHTYSRRETDEFMLIIVYIIVSHCLQLFAPHTIYHSANTNENMSETTSHYSRQRPPLHRMYRENCVRVCVCGRRSRAANSNGMCLAIFIFLFFRCWGGESATRGPEIEDLSFYVRLKWWITRCQSKMISASGRVSLHSLNRLSSFSLCPLVSPLYSMLSPHFHRMRL